MSEVVSEVGVDGSVTALIFRRLQDWWHLRCIPRDPSDAAVAHLHTNIRGGAGAGARPASDRSDSAVGGFNTAVSGGASPLQPHEVQTYVRTLLRQCEREQFVRHAICSDCSLTLETLSAHEELRLDPFLFSRGAIERLLDRTSSSASPSAVVATVGKNGGGDTECSCRLKNRRKRTQHTSLALSSSTPSSSSSNSLSSSFFQITDNSSSLSTASKALASLHANFGASASGSDGSAAALSAPPSVWSGVLACYCSLQYRCMYSDLRNALPSTMPMCCPLELLPIRPALQVLIACSGGSNFGAQRLLVSMVNLVKRLCPSLLLPDKSIHLISLSLTLNEDEEDEEPIEVGGYGGSKQRHGGDSDGDGSRASDKATIVVSKHGSSMRAIEQNLLNPVDFKDLWTLLMESYGWAVTRVDDAVCFGAPTCYAALEPK